MLKASCNEVKAHFQALILKIIKIDFDRTC